MSVLANDSHESEERPFVAKFMTIGYGDKEGYRRTDATRRTPMTLVYVRREPIWALPGRPCRRETTMEPA